MKVGKTDQVLTLLENSVFTQNLTRYLVQIPLQPKCFRFLFSRMAVIISIIKFINISI